MGKRLYGLYQYPNATASAMGAAIFLSLGLSLNSSKLYEKLFYCLVMAATFPVLILTLSRGAYVVFAVIAIANLIILEARRRVQYVYSMVMLTAANGVFLFQYFGTEKSGNLAGYLLIGAVVYFSAQILYEKVIAKKISTISTKAVNIVLLVLLAVTVLFAAVLFSVKTPMEYTIEHASGEAKSWKNKGLLITDLAPDSKYTVKLYVKSTMSSEYSYGVTVDSVNGNGERSNIISQFAPAGEGYKPVSYDFTTKADTKDIILILYNYEENSSTTYKDIRVLDSDGNIVKKFEKFKYLPETIANRLMDISLETENVSARVYYVKDGLKILKDNILLGTGGGGWKSLYRKYQSLPYDSNEAHNFYLQYAIETGIIGILALLAIYYLFISRSIKAVFKQKRYEQIPYYFSLIMMMGHAFMDFDLSLTAYAILFWTIMGIAGKTDQESIEWKSNKRILNIVVLAVAVAVVVISSSIYSGMINGREAASLMAKDVNKSIDLYKSAMKKDPFNNNYYMDYMQIMYSNYKKNQDVDSLGEMQNSIDKVLKTDVYDIQQTTVITRLLLGTGDIDRALAIVDRIIESNPMVGEIYLYKMDINYEVAKYLFSTKQHKQALPFLNKILEAESQFNIASQRAVKPMKMPDKMDDLVKVAKLDKYSRIKIVIKNMNGV